MALDFSEIFSKYEALVADVDKIANQIKEQHGDLVACEKGCSDCCNALFDLTLIEAVYLNHHFTENFQGFTRSEILEQADAADRRAYQIKREAFNASKKGKTTEQVLEALARTRLRCPLLSDDDLCHLYEHRPITCRLYGVPFGIDGKAHTCSKCGFEAGKSYPTVHMDKIQSRLVALSQELAKSIDSKYTHVWDVLVPVSMAVLNNYDEAYFRIGEEAPGASCAAPAPAPEAAPSTSECGQNPDSCGVEGGCDSCGYSITLGGVDEDDSAKESG